MKREAAIVIHSTLGVQANIPYCRSVSLIGVLLCLESVKVETCRPFFPILVYCPALRIVRSAATALTHGTRQLHHHDQLPRIQVARSSQLAYTHFRT